MGTTMKQVMVAGCSGLVLLIASSAPALSYCIKKHPIFGVDVYVEDKYCPKPAAQPAKKQKAKQVKNKPVIRKSTTVRKPDPEIRELQNLLTRAGYAPGSIDGHYGPKTRAAARAFKKSQGMKVGTDAEETIEALKRVTAKPKSDPEIAELQALLAKAGYDPGPVTGRKNAKTRAAARAFKKSQGMKVGTDAEETIEALKKLKRKK